MADSYHSDTVTIPRAWTGWIRRDEDAVSKLRGEAEDRALAMWRAERKLIKDMGRRADEDPSSCVAFFAACRSCSAGAAIERLVKTRYQTHALGLLDDTSVDLRLLKLGWGVGLVTILDSTERIAAAAFDLRSLLDWCETVGGSEAVAQALRTGMPAESLRANVRAARLFEAPCYTEFDDPNGGYEFYYLATLLATLDFAARTSSAVIHIQLTPNATDVARGRTANEL
jgi:hypothetical protein